MKRQESLKLRMSPDRFDLKEGAILVADAHCAPWRPVFIDFLRALESAEVATPQLILMGDIFDLLFGDIEDTHTLNRDAIALLKRLSTRIEILYLEGNHDFRLGKLFPNIRVVERCNQPFQALFNHQTIALSHGDTDMGWGYELYTAVIRNVTVLKLLNRLNRLGGGVILKRLILMMKHKVHCKEIEGFEILVEHRISRANTVSIDILVEGHFHQNRAFDFPGIGYVNLGAFACNERYYGVQSLHNRMVLKELFFRKEPK